MYISITVWWGEEKVFSLDHTHPCYACMHDHEPATWSLQAACSIFCKFTPHLCSLHQKVSDVTTIIVVSLLIHSLIIILYVHQHTVHACAIYAGMQALKGYYTVVVPQSISKKVGRYHKACMHVLPVYGAYYMQLYVHYDSALQCHMHRSS